MRSYYDDNYGHWNMEDEDDLEFYRYVQNQSVWKVCADCGERVKIMPDYACCDSCADRRERGGF